MGRKDVERLATVEANYSNLQRSVDLILSNHLPHLKEQIDDLREDLGTKIEGNRANTEQKLDAQSNSLYKVIGAMTILIPILVSLFQHFVK